MSLVTSQFDPSGQYFASVIVSLDSHVLRVQSSTSSTATNNSTSQSFSTVFPLPKGFKVLNISWVPNTINGSLNHSFKKQKLASRSLENQLISIVLENSNLIYIYSPSVNEVLKTVKVTSKLSLFKYGLNKFWGLDLANQLFEFDEGFELINTVNLNDYLNESFDNVQFKAFKHLSKKQVILSSNSLYLLDDKNIQHLNSNHINEIEEIKLINDDKYALTYTKNDRFINCLDLEKNSLVKIYVTENSILKVDYFKNEEFKLDMLVALTDDGKIEVFNDPFSITNDKQSSAASKYSKRKNVKKSVSSNYKINVSRPSDQLAENLVFEDLKLDNKHLILTWLENSSIPFFHHLEWWNNAVDGSKLYRS
ncbi:unnamed protein product [Ambrosiozyma monospora]|uniref:Unnamed protein product n=1 Tax=Ambrosiozyma monospora TaxID=43982 RepID=A0ACB5SYL8_AMBMO|nr:unnamed protein product [Ambrosiozyma monospora]